mmetsp:Transcript_8605/g.8146  ORF Transcript_8605/g.8146 Transcript_8605/m.8146 type:complete len:135 (-) Transcript_8605:279-683(-)
MKCTIIATAALFSSASALNNAYLRNMPGNTPVQPYTPAAVNQPVHGNDYLSTMGAPAATTYAAPAPVATAPIAPAPVTAAFVPSAAATPIAVVSGSGIGMRTFADMLSGGSVQKYTEPAPKMGARSNDYLSTLA